MIQHHFPRFRRHALGVLAMLALAACSRTQPSPLPPPAIDPPLAPSVEAVAVRIQGRVIDDRSAAATGATVSLVYRDVEPVTVTTDVDGRFALSATLPGDWRQASLVVGGEGYERTDQYAVIPVTVDQTFELEAFRTVTIRPGESIEADVGLGAYICGWFGEEIPCRRIVVELPAGESADVDVVPVAGWAGVGLIARQPPSDYQLRRHATVTAGEVWIVSFRRATVALTARAR